MARRSEYPQISRATTGGIAGSKRKIHGGI
jgi:hypothetical protein